MGTSIVRLKGVESNSYLCMDDEGICRVMVSVAGDSYNMRVLDAHLPGWTRGMI